MSIAAKTYTWSDIEHWPESAQRTEIVHGELVVSPVPGIRHHRINTKLALFLGEFVRSKDAGELFVSPVDVVLAPDVVYEPDMSFVRSERLNILQESHVAGPPDLVIEIISESNRTHDTVVKFQDYARYGVAEYWLADPREKILSTWWNRGGEFELLAHTTAGGRVITRVLDGLEIDPAAVFQD